VSNYIRKIEDSGKLIILNDSSKWEVGSYDSFTTRMWMIMDNVSVSLNKMINLSRNNETVSVTRKY
jgi:hypothetical protein